MSGAKFTKGPWRVAGKTPSRVYGWIREDKESIVASTSGALGETGPNAHLIAAAPELYNALDMLMDASGPGDAAQLLAEERENIMEILAKARGETV